MTTSWPGLHAAREDGRVGVLMADHHGLADHRVVRLHDIDVIAVRPALHGRRGHRHRVMHGRCLHPHPHEAAGPQRLLRIGERRLQLDRAGGRIDLVIEDGQRAPIQHGAGRRPRLVHRQHRRRCRGGHRGGDLRQILLRQVEHHRDRLQLREHDQPGRVGGMDDVAGIDRADAGPSGDRGGDGGVAQHRARGVDRRLIALDLRGQLRHQRFLRVRRLPGGVLVLHQLLVPHEVDPRVRQQRLVLRLLRHRLIERRLIGAGVDPRQHLSLGDLLALLEIDLQQLAVHHRLDGDGVERLHRPQRVEPDRHVALLRGRDEHRDRRVRRPAGRGRRRLVRRPEPDRRADRRQQKRRYQPRQRAAPAGARGRREREVVARADVHASGGLRPVASITGDTSLPAASHWIIPGSGRATPPFRMPGSRPGNALSIEPAGVTHPPPSAL